MEGDKRSRLQLRLDRIRWQPFCYITPGNVILKNPLMWQYRQAALVTTAIIARMMYTVANEKGIGGYGK